MGRHGGTHGWLIDGEASLDKYGEQHAQSHACQNVHGAAKVENHQEWLVEESQNSGEGDDLPKNVRSSSLSHARTETQKRFLRAERETGKQTNKAGAKRMKRGRTGTEQNPKAIRVGLLQISFAVKGKDEEMRR